MENKERKILYSVKGDEIKFSASIWVNLEDVRHLRECLADLAKRIKSKKIVPKRLSQ